MEPDLFDNNVLSRFVRQYHSDLPDQSALKVETGN